MKASAHSSPSSSHPVGVIGAGLGGLAAACTLAARGHRVTCFEANSWVGGKAAVLEDRGFRFDMGPTILTLPMVLRRIFAEAGQSLEDAVDLVRLDPQWRCFFEDGSVLDLVEDTAAMQQKLREFSKSEDDAAGYQRFMNWSGRLRGISDRFFFWKSIGSVRDMMNARASFNLSTLSDVLSMRMGKSVGQMIRSHVRDPRVAQMLDHFTQYVGSCPDNSPAILCSIANMQTHDGIWYPRCGTGAIPAAMRQLAQSLGVEFLQETEIAQIEVRDGVVVGVRTADDEMIPLSAVVSNMDAVRTHRELLSEQGDAAVRFERQRRYEPACSGVVLYLGLDRAYEHLLHHNFVFSKDPEAEFHAIYKAGVPAPDPTCYVCAPARTEPGVAPAGGEALYILVHTPYLRPGQDWKEMLPGYRRVILDKLARTAGLKDLESRIVVEHTLTPQDIHDRYRVLNGAIYGLASHGKWFGAFKPINRSPLVKGLYLAGGAAHPGPGMPMVLMSGWIAADALDTDTPAAASRKAQPTEFEQPLAHV